MTRFLKTTNAISPETSAELQQTTRFKHGSRSDTEDTGHRNQRRRLIFHIHTHAFLY